MSTIENQERAWRMFSGLKWLAAMTSLLWLSMVAPPVTLIALLSGAPFYAFWGFSLWFLPAMVLLLLAVFRTHSRTFRWWVFQYLGVSAICFTAAGSGVLLSIFLANSIAGAGAVLLAIVFCAWGFRSAHKIHTVTVNINNPKIGKNLRLVQISDVHIGSRKPEFLEKVMQQVRQQSPDLLVITGDLVDENVAFEDLAPLASMSCPVLYCSGNHERYIKYAQVLEDIASQGVRVLSDQFVDVSGLRVIGVEDRQHRHEAVEALDQLKLVADRTDTLVGSADCKIDDPFTVLLYHQPDIWDAAKRHGIELMLSGHTHNGQIWPFGLLVRTRYAHVAGHFQASPYHLFVSQGTGTWGPLMRFGTRCEMTIVELSSD